MKLYPKKLNGVEELEREKQLLQYAKDHSDKNGKLFPDNFLGIVGKKGNDEKENTSSPVGESMSLQALAIDLLMKFGKRRAQKAGKKMAAGAAKAGGNAIKSFATEFVLGYLKWKAIELAYKGIKGYINSRKEHSNK